MPIYEYLCEKCGKLNDVLQKVNDPPPKQCNGCEAKGQLRKIVSRSSFLLRGGGWYSDLYSSTRKDAGAKSPDAGSAETKTSGTKGEEGSKALGSPAKTEFAASSPPASPSGGSKKVTSAKK